MTNEQDVGHYYMDMETNRLYRLASYCKHPTVYFVPVSHAHELSISCADGAPPMKNLVKLVPQA